MNKTIYACTHIEKLIETDDFEQGCQGDCRCVLDASENITAETLPGLIEAIGDHCGLEMDQVDVPWFDFSPEIAEFFVVDQLENDQGIGASDREKELWKQGQTTLYLATWRFYIEKRILSGVSYEEFNEAGIETCIQDGERRQDLGHHGGR